VEEPEIQAQNKWTRLAVHAKSQEEVKGEAGAGLLPGAWCASILDQNA
jgi:hypothetical protein